ncbi:MAG: NADH-quinone oxidoreductase subunit [Verrucomicrobiales bacterium]|nr:NADH-quinone oxidoreductase subunit [Verrucomicrobiales bacterium]
MNASLMILEIIVGIAALGLLLVDLWMPVSQKKFLGYAAAAVLGIVLIYSFYAPQFSGLFNGQTQLFAFGNMYVLDPLALYFKRFFLVAAIIVLFMAVEFADRIDTGISEFYALILFALLGMMYAASANDFVMVFVSLELITVTFYVLTSYQRAKQASLEAGIKYLILGALSSAVLVFGIALVFGVSGTTSFPRILAQNQTLIGSPIFLLGSLMVLCGIAFKIAAFPFQSWAPDVYQGSPGPVTAFLAVGSKAAGFVLLLRILFGSLPDVVTHWPHVLIIISGISILYGNLCAIPQRNLKRLLGYSSISNAGYILLGVAALSREGDVAVLYYLLGYLFTVLGAFAVINRITRGQENEDISLLAGLYQRSPLLALCLTLSMASLVGVPSVAGFMGKFLLVMAAIQKGAGDPAYYILVFITIAGVGISAYYYFGVVRAIYFSKNATDLSPIPISLPTRMIIYVCMAGMIYLGLFPQAFISLASNAVKVLHG